MVHGDPRIEEPLAIAWNRALDRLGLSKAFKVDLPYCLHSVVAAFPGDTEIAKITRALSSAPSWLLAFCNASVDCFVLEIELPKSSEPAPEYGRDGLREAWHAWPDLPKGILFPNPIPGSRLALKKAWI
jgi:hypothetical protein